MDAGIRAAGSGYPAGCSGELPQRPLKLGLNGRLVRLELKAVVVVAFVFYY
jgi:hypothetical protein